MATFNGETLTITLDPFVDNVLNFDWETTYSEWKDWSREGTNLKYPQAFRTSGGDPINTILDSGSYYFLRNDYGWRIKPYEDDGTYYVAGNLTGEDATLPIFIDTTGAYTVGILGLQPVTQAINQDIIAEAVWDEPISDHLIAGTTGASIGNQQFDGYIHIDTASSNSGTTFPTGTDAYPVNNLVDALSIAATRGIGIIKLESDLTIGAGENISGYIFDSDTRREVTLSASGFNYYSAFKNCGLTGTSNGHIALENCSIDGLSEFYGVAEECTQSGSLTISSDNTKNAILVDLRTGDVPSPPTIDFNGDGAKLSLRGLTGAVLFTNKTGSTQKGFIDLYSARVGFDSTVTAGTFTVRGIGYIYLDNSTGTTFDTEGLMSKATIGEAVWDEPVADHLLADTMGHQMYHEAYGGIVHVNTATGASGTTFPTGTSHEPCDNLTDALTIASTHFIPMIHVEGALTIDGEDITGYTIAADRSLGNSVTITSMANTGACYFQDITVSGALTGATRFTTCVLGALTGFDGGAKDSLLTGAITISGTGANYFTNCDTYITSPSALIELSIGSTTLNLIRCRGGYNLTNKTSTNTLAFDLVAGLVTVDASCSAGSIMIGGIAEVTDNSAAGCTVSVKALSNPTISDTVWDELTADHTDAGSMGKAISDAGGSGNPWSLPVSGNQTAGTFGEFVSKKLLKFSKWLGLN